MHVHAEHQGSTAKFWINPVRPIYNMGMSSADFAKAARLVRRHEKLIQEKWNEFFSRKKV